MPTHRSPRSFADCIAAFCRKRLPYLLGPDTDRLEAYLLDLIVRNECPPLHSTGYSWREIAANKPTVVLVHGAFADSSSWNSVIPILQQDGYQVVAAPNPLRGVRSDACVIADVVKGIEGPVVLVGHSYGGSVISEAAERRPNVKALVYVAAFAPEAGETAIGLTGKFPGSTLGSTFAPPVKLTSGGNDLYIQQPRFRAQSAADVAPQQAGLMAAGQRPIAEAALSEVSTAPAWKSLPSWFIYGDRPGFPD